ncbi:MAG: endonuclease [Paludibacteraceae bacterium]|nr:endonuclease [Paludibacteraceae bacterium]
MTLIRHIFLSALLLVSFLYLQAQPSPGYYNNAVGKKQKDLKTALHVIINPHTAIEYYSSATSFRTTDWHPDGYFWDMYSNVKKTTWSGSGLNREHNMPKSWFGIASGEESSEPIGTDLHNLYPSERNANSAKSNYALGVVGASPTFNNGVVKVGKSAYPGYSGTVFEPANEYKGDFARCYMYMVTCYEDYATRWTSTGVTSMLSNNAYPVFKPYAINLLMEWHRNDPVSSKEINRNNAVDNIQRNRNPFVDFPVLAEYIWGEYQDESWDGTNRELGNFYVHYNNESQKLFVNVPDPLDAAFIIYNTSGFKLLEGKPDSEGSIDVSDLPKGLYVAVVYAKGKRHAEKFLHGESYN